MTDIDKLPDSVKLAIVNADVPVPLTAMEVKLLLDVIGESDSIKVKDANRLIKKLENAYALLTTRVNEIVENNMKSEIKEVVESELSKKKE
ncbi:g291 [Yersinia phage phiR1-37]|uniref:hypothetical protein n=1 Tax=Yersinia phage phiR1-37 TaxID=331278 RepID=UPI00022DBDCE|nr:hypothetical protein phiR1-37_gp291 [Yersinia phage phiR1-37]CCE26314.1 g291 [Yersinia phage phiR1-37]